MIKVWFAMLQPDLFYVRKDSVPIGMIAVLPIELVDAACLCQCLWWWLTGGCCKLLYLFPF